MFKKICLTSLITLASLNVNLATAAAAPYLGAGLGITVNTASHSQHNGNAGNFRGVPFNLFAGYGGVLTENFYLAGEIKATITTAEISSDNGLKTSYGYGASVLPGVMLSDHTLAFARLGIVQTNFSDVSDKTTGGQLGLGLQTILTQNVDVRFEYDFTAYNNAHLIQSPRSDAFNLDLVYKFS